MRPIHTQYQIPAFARLGNEILGTFVDALRWRDALDRIREWAAAHESRYVCICNVHSLVTASRNLEHRGVVNSADMATPDGAPVAWMLRRLGFNKQERINGPDLMWRYCELAEQTGQAIYLFGSTERTLEQLEHRLLQTMPRLRIAGAQSPPFRPMTEEEDAGVVDEINRSGAGVVFVGLGCPKQERWMAAHRGRIRAVMIGVGAAFEFHAGTLKRAPVWMQKIGLEWLHRLVSEPRRLWRRYLVGNTLFIVGAIRQLTLFYAQRVTQRFGSSGGRS